MHAATPMSEVASIVRLRWAAMLLGGGAVAVAVLVLDLPLSAVALAALLGVLGISNVALAVRSTRAAVGPVLLLDVALLTVALALSGGPSNPFSILYLVYVTLAAVLVPGAYTWALVALSAAGYGLLFAVTPIDPHAHHHGGDTSFSLHLQGMWIAFTLAAVLIAAFVTRVSRALETEREKAARTARLLGLTTLAAGAAHELSTPLSTIKTVASELERALADRPDLEALRDDARLVRAEVDRSRAVLDRLSLRAGELRGENAEPVPLRSLAEGLADLPQATRSRVDVACGEATVRVPRRALEQVLTSLVRNALDASAIDAHVELALRADERALVCEVGDRGTGMSADALARAGEPFFTTKQPEQGMGLGLFLARTLVHQLGGTLDIASKLGEGTRVVVRIPNVVSR
jgi:two-component system sensor histidine kinase RegB